MTDLLLRALLVLAVVAGVSAIGWWVQRRDGRLREAADARFDAAQLRAVGLDPHGADAVALLLGSPTCAPCATVQRILGEVAASRPRFRWVYADAADHLDIAESHRVMRVPTLFILAPDGRIVARTSGVPTIDDVVAVLDRDGSLEAASAA